jgi:fido (protein-threonine AMPylation protein)
MSDFDRDWERVVRIGVTDKIQSLEDYRRHVSEGLDLAASFLYQVNTLSLTPTDVRVAHAVAFGQVHPWAGTYRKVEVSAGNMICTHPRKIGSELSYLCSTGKLLFEGAEEARRLKAIALFHATFEEIHPFLDGNGRIGRSIAEAQLRVSFGKDVRLILQRDEYMGAIRRAQAHQDYIPLARTFAEGIGLTVDRSKELISLRRESKEETRER